MAAAWRAYCLRINVSSALTGWHISIDITTFCVELWLNLFFHPCFAASSSCWSAVILPIYLALSIYIYIFISVSSNLELQSPRSAFIYLFINFIFLCSHHFLFGFSVCSCGFIRLFAFSLFIIERWVSVVAAKDESLKSPHSFWDVYPSIHLSYLLYLT